MSSDFTHLHTHSHYSLLDGLGKIDEIVQRVKELGMNSIALTDHGAMYGAIEFAQTCKEAGVKPIIGMEAYLSPHGRMEKRGKIDTNPRHLTLIAQTNEGYKNLMRLSTIAHLEGYYYKPRIDYESLEQYNKGLIVLSGCLNGDIPQAILMRRDEDVQRLIEWHLSIFSKDRFYLEIQNHPNIREQQIVNEALISYARKYHIDLVATCDSHYIHPDDAAAQDVLLCVQTGKTVQQKDRLCMLDEDYSLKSPREVKLAFRDCPQAIENTQKIAEMCMVEFEFGSNKLPRFPLPPGVTADDALREACERGVSRRYGAAPSPAIKKRLDYELDVIQKTGFAPYFLIVADFVNEAKQRGILVGPGRGSAAGSLVSYVTNITNVDPLRYNLLFERFLNPERVSMPDIDLDFADDRRGEVIEYVREKYGSEHVSQIITFGTMAPRAAVRDAGRALGFPYAFCDRIAKSIPMFTNFEQALSISAELKEMYNGDPQAKKLIDMARKLEGVCRHASTHAAAVVITDKPLTEYVPLQLSSTAQGNTETVTQYAMGPVESLGLLKMDFLGLKNLTIIQKTLDTILERGGGSVELDAIPLDDVATYKLLQQGRTVGVFQLESSGMRRYLKELAPTQFEDIISILALYRPGPMDSIPDFIAAKHGRKAITYIHPRMAPILEKTYGVIVTQDQVLQIARDFAGFTYAEADILRKAVGKKIRKLLEEQRQKFIKGSIQTSHVDIETAERVWEFIEPFARYGFNRAHAACYAMIAYQTAYLKANFPAEFMAALLTSDEGNTDRQAIEVADAMNLGITILPPGINESAYDYSVVQTDDGKPAIRFGLGAIKNIGHGIVQAIIEERNVHGPFRDLSDVFRRVNSKDLNKKSVESMAKAGVFDSLAERATALENTENLLSFNRSIYRKRDTGQKDLFGTNHVSVQPRINIAEAQPSSKETRLQWEKELLGLYISEHPLSEFRGDLEHIVLSIAELPGAAPEHTIRLAGVITRINKIITKSGKPMLFVTIEDTTSNVEILVFPNLLESSGELWADGAKVIVEGKISERDGEIKILVDKAWTLSFETLQQFNVLPPQSHQKPATIQIRVSSQITRDNLERLRSYLAQHHNTEFGIPVELIMASNGGFRTIKTQFAIPFDKHIIDGARELVMASPVPAP